MTRDVWQTYDDPRQMLWALRDRISARKLRLLAAACWRAAVCHGEVGEGERPIEVNERAADDPYTWEAINAAAFDLLIQSWWDVYKFLPDGGTEAHRRLEWQLALDVFGMAPGRELAEAVRRDRQVLALGEAAYQERLFPAGTLDTARLAVLGDALEEVGCAHAELLGHLRGPGPHVRGCWALDLILAKE